MRIAQPLENQRLKLFLIFFVFSLAKESFGLTIVPQAANPAASSEPNQTTTVMTLSTIQTLALSKSVKEAAEKAARAETNAGTHEVDFTVRIKGTLKVGEDYEKKSSCSIPFKAVIALMAQRMGFQRDAAIALITECVADAMKANMSKGDVATSEGAEDDMGLETLYKDMIDKACETLPKTPTKGAVKANLEILTVE